MWIYIIAGISATIVCLIVLTVWDPFTRNLGIEKLPDIVRMLLIRMENGGFCRLDHRDSDVWFSIERLDGTDTAATLALRVPRQEWTLAVADELHKTYESLGFEWVDEVDNPSLLAKVLIPIDDIWAISSAAPANRVVRLFVDAVGLPASAKYSLEQAGRRVNRGYVEH